MKALIFAGMLIIFISAIFVLFIIDDLTEKYLDCLPGTDNKILCSLRDFGLPFVTSLAFMGVFVLIDCLVLYFLFKALVVKGSYSYTSASDLG